MRKSILVPLFLLAIASCLLSARLFACPVSHARYDERAEQELLGWAKQGKSEKVKALIETGANANARGEFGDTPVIWAAFHHNTKLVDYLLAKGANPNGIMQGYVFGIRDARGGTALMYALRHKDATMVKALLTHKANVEEIDDEYNLPLVNAIETQQPELVRLLLEYNANPNGSGDYVGTPLASATWNTEILRLLLEHGAKVHVKMRNGMTPLHYAIRNTLSLQMLLDKGADANAASDQGLTPLLYAIEQNTPEAARILIESGAEVDALSTIRNVTPLIKAAEQGNAAMVKLLLEKGADVNKATPSGKTALIQSAIRGNLPTLQALLEKRAGVHHRDEQGMTALMWAAALSDVSRMQALLDAGADIHVQDSFGRTALLIAAQYSNKETLRFCIKEGLDVKRRCPKDVESQGLHKGDSALMLVSNETERDMAVRRLLLQTGVDINSANAQGQTALMRATSYGWRSTVTFLLAHGAKTKQRNKK